MFFDVAKFRSLATTRGPHWSYTELVGAFIMSLSSTNPIRRWLEADAARLEARRLAWQAGRDAEWAAVKRSNAELLGLLNLDRGPTDAMH